MEYKTFSSNTRHTNSAVNSSDIDAAAVDFGRRFHISVDDSADQQVRIVRLEILIAWNNLIFFSSFNSFNCMFALSSPF